MAEEDEANGEAPKPPKTKAEDNPWYLLARLYGVPEPKNPGLFAKNRRSCNRYFAVNLDEEMRTRLINERGYAQEELPHSLPVEARQRIKTDFASRCADVGRSFPLPKSKSNIDYTNVQFAQAVDFNKYLFHNSCFRNASFKRQANFSGATFFGPTLFEGACFSSLVEFDGADFAFGPIFARATFSDLTSFGGTTFCENTHFGRASFGGFTSFAGATFLDRRNRERVIKTTFDSAIFKEAAAFNGATFSDVEFSGAKFYKLVSFVNTIFVMSSRFDNAKMKGETSFERATFEAEPPAFFNTKLHQGTVWRDIKHWPKPKNKDQAGRFIDAYACLNLEMDGLKKHEDELDFFALELQSRRVMLGPWRGLPIAIYGTLSDYGRSYCRPLAWLFGIVVFGAAMFRRFGALALGEASGLSATNTLNVFGFRKDFFDAAAIECLPAPLKILSAVQTILGTILLFLFGLGVRNKFRMK